MAAGKWRSDPDSDDDDVDGYWWNKPPADSSFESDWDSEAEEEKWWVEQEGWRTPTPSPPPPNDAEEEENDDDDEDDYEDDDDDGERRPSASASVCASSDALAVAYSSSATASTIGGGSSSDASASSIPEGTSDDDKTRIRLAAGPSTMVTSWQGYEVNGYTFYTRAKDSKSKAQNSSVRGEAPDPITGDAIVDYFGVIEDIWELDYGNDIIVTVMRCQWVKRPGGVEVDKCGVTLVDLDNVGTWMIPGLLLPGVWKQRIAGVDGVEDLEEYNLYEEMLLYKDFMERIKQVEGAYDLAKMKPYMHKDGVGKTVKG
ncbi:hypothetical protein ACP4OV_004930 [Aristida adscensionis]